MQLAEKNDPGIIYGGSQTSVAGDDSQTKQSFWQRELTLVNGICLLALGFYTYYFLESLPRWFHPAWTTDDALQQVYPFFEALRPGVFTNDLVSEVMIGYLAPLHYWLCYGITRLTGDPIMMGHWVMLIQLSLTCLFLFMAIRSQSSTAAGLCGVLWLLHTRQIVQRLTSGLPRGWAAVVICAALYFILSKRHKAVLLTLFIGCLLHPPATLIVALCYGLYLTVGLLWPATRASCVKPWLALVLLSPLYVVTTYSVVHRPEHIGQMVSFEEASAMPEFQYPDGRFPFTPLRPVDWELKTYSFQAFIGRFFSPPAFFRSYTRTLVVFGLLALLAVGFWKRREVLPPALYSFLAAILLTYFASRIFAFKLYVPNRHLQFPMAFFFIMAFCIGVWRALFLSQQRTGTIDFQDSAWGKSWRPLIGLFVVASLVGFSSGSGLQGDANFNYSRDKKGQVFEWIRKNTTPDSLIAGHPTYIDGVMLFGERRALITTETAHPFYQEYNREVQRRLKISLAAHYARTLQELYDILLPEGVDYFIFERKQFYPEALARAEYHPPLDKFVSELASRDYREYAYRQLPDQVDLQIAPFMPFKDAQAALIDIRLLGKFLKEQ